MPVRVLYRVWRLTAPRWFQDTRDQETPWRDLKNAKDGKGQDVDTLVQPTDATTSPPDGVKTSDAQHLTVSSSES